MTVLTCEQVRDLLPEWAAGTAPAAVGEHLAACDECRAESDVVRALHAALPPVPGGLELRVLRATRAQPAVRAWRSARQLAVAATVVGALLGGTLLVRTLGIRTDSSPADSTAAATAPAPLLPVLEDPALGAGSVLPNLTDRELEALLARMDS